MFQSGSLHLLISKPIARWAFVPRQVFGRLLLHFDRGNLSHWRVLDDSRSPFRCLGIEAAVCDSGLPVRICDLFTRYLRFPGLCLEVRLPRSASRCSSSLPVCRSSGPSPFTIRPCSPRIVLWILWETDDGVIAVSELGISHRWDEEDQEWDSVFASDEQKQTLWVFRWVPVLGSEVRPVGPDLRCRPTAADRRVAFFLGRAEKPLRRHCGGQLECSERHQHASRRFCHVRGAGGQPAVCFTHRHVSTGRKPAGTGDAGESSCSSSCHSRLGMHFKRLVQKDLCPWPFPAAAAFNSSTGDLLLYSRRQLVVNSPEEKTFVRAAGT